MDSLLTLDLSDNQLTEMFSLVNVPNIENIKISANRISRITGKSIKDNFVFKRL